MHGCLSGLLLDITSLQIPEFLFLPTVYYHKQSTPIFVPPLVLQQVRGHSFAVQGRPSKQPAHETLCMADSSCGCSYYERCMRSALEGMLVKFLRGVTTPSHRQSLHVPMDLQRIPKNSQARASKSGEKGSHGCFRNPKFSTGGNDDVLRH
jgi:hypothetical protein